MAVDDVEFEAVFGDEGIHRFNDQRPGRRIIVARDDAAALQLGELVAEGRAIQLAIVRVAIDVDEIEGLIAKQRKRLVEPHAHERVSVTVRA